MMLEMNLQQIEADFMMEQFMRIIDYSLNYIANLFNTGQANADFAMEESETEDDAASSVQEKPSDNDIKSSFAGESEMQSVDIESDDGRPRNFWENFDLKQEPHVPMLALNLNAPLIIMRNLSEPEERFELDFGTISIKSSLVYE